VYTGQNYNVGIAPAGFLGGRPPRSDQAIKRVPEDRVEDVDPRVKWAQKQESLLRQEKEPVTTRMRRAWGLFNGDGHWGKNRAKWKVKATINYCNYVPQQWTATLTANDIKANFSAYNKKDQDDADIVTAAYVDAHARLGWQAIKRDAVLISRVESKAFYRLTYDPWANGGDGDPNLRAVPGSQVYLNAGATSVDDAEVLMYEYEESYGSLVQKYPHLKDKLKQYARRQRERDQDGQQISVPQQSFTSPGGTTSHTSEYTTEAGGPDANSSHGGIPVREFWTRPKGPQSQRKIQSIKFTVGNEPATKSKTITFEDGREEPLQTVITEGNIVYELPYSQVELLKLASDLGGLKVIAVHDAVDVVKEDKTVNLYPTGRRLVIAGDVVADDGMNPFSHGDWPFIAISAWKDPRFFWGLGDIDLIADLNEYVNRMYSLFLDAALLTSNPIWRIPMGAEISDEDITNAPGAIMREDPQSLKLGKREAGPDMPAYLMQTLNFGIDRIKEISGLSEAATGKMPKGQVSTEAMAMGQESAGVRFKDAGKDLERAEVRLGQQFKGIMAQFYGSPRLARIKNSAGVDTAITFFGTQIQTPMTLSVKSGSMLPTSSTTRLQYMLTLLNSPKPVVDLLEVWGLLAEVGLIDSASALEHRITKELADPKQAWKVIGIPQAGGKKPGAKQGQQPKKPNSSNNKSHLSGG
jgi:hypothetical protein